MNITDLKHLLCINAPVEDLAASIKESESTAAILGVLREQAPDLHHIPLTTYTLYRQFEHVGERDSYQKPYFQKRILLTRAVLEMIMGDFSAKVPIQDLLWSICEETSWVLPAHEEQGPDYWDIHPPVVRTASLTSHTSLTRQPDSIDLFAAETGASLAETLFLVGEYLDPEVVYRVQQEVERRIFKPYLAYGRKHWWFKGALNWNGVCNGAVGLAFMRLEKDPQILAEAISQVLEGFDAYIKTGFEPDGGSIEGIGYWNYGLMYFVALAELLRERTAGKVDVLADPQMIKIAHFPFTVALSPGLYVALGDATENLTLEPGIITRLVERTGFKDLLGLLTPIDNMYGKGLATSKLSILMRDAAWWNGKVASFPLAVYNDYYLPDSEVIKLTGRTSYGKPVIVVAKAGHNDGHHSHTDVGTFVYHVDGESILVDPGRGHYSKNYFRQSRYQNLFCNSLSHCVPVINGCFQEPGPEFGGKKEFHGTIISHGGFENEKFVIIDLQNAYQVDGLKICRRLLKLNPPSGWLEITDTFVFEPKPLPIEESFVTWANVSMVENTAEIIGEKSGVVIEIVEPADCVFSLQSFEKECSENHREGILKRLFANLPEGKLIFKAVVKPIERKHK